MSWYGCTAPLIANRMRGKASVAPGVALTTHASSYHLKVAVRVACHVLPKIPTRLLPEGIVQITPGSKIVSLRSRCESRGIVQITPGLKIVCLCWTYPVYVAFLDPLLG